MLACGHYPAEQVPDETYAEGFRLRHCLWLFGPPRARAEPSRPPPGKLRVGLIAVNPIFVTPNTPPGVTKGIAVDIAGQLAARIGVPMELLRYPTVGALVESAGKGEWDIAFLAIDPERARRQ